MPRASRAQSAATAAALLDAARSLFAEHGYADVGLEDVASQVGVTRGAVYNHFSSKPALFAAVLDDAQRSVGDAIEAATVGVEDAWEALEVGCRAFLAASTDERVRRIVLVDAPAVLGWSRWREVDAEHAGSSLAEVLRVLAAEGRLGDAHVDAVAVLLSGAMNEAALWIAESDAPGADVDTAWASLVVLLRGLKVDAQAGSGSG